MSKLKNPNTIQKQVKATPSWQLVGPSYHLALKNYEAIAFLFFIPALFQILGGYYLGSLLNINSKNHTIHLSTLTPREELGLALLIVWLVLSIINFAPSIFLRIHAADAKAPSVTTCYREGFKVFWKVLFSELIFLVIVGLGFIALILPGLLLFRRYVFAPYYAAQNPQLSFKEIFKLSSLQSSKFIYDIYGAYLVVLIISLLASAALGGYLIGSVAVALITYSVLFVPALRYLEIVKYYKTHSISSTFNSGKTQPEHP